MLLEEKVYISLDILEVHNGYIWNVLIIVDQVFCLREFIKIACWLIETVTSKHLKFKLCLIWK